MQPAENGLQVYFIHAEYLENSDKKIKELLCVPGQGSNHYKSTYPRGACCVNTQTPTYDNNNNSLFPVLENISSWEFLKDFELFFIK